MPAGCSRLKTSGMFPCVRNVAGKDSGNISFTGHVGFTFNFDSVSHASINNIKDESPSRKTASYFAMLGVVTGMFGGTGLLDPASEELLLFGEHVVPGPLSLKHPALEFEIITFIVNLFHVKVLYMIVMFFLQGWIGSPVKRFQGHLNIGRIQIPLNAEGISLQFSNRILTDQILAISRSSGHLHTKNTPTHLGESWGNSPKLWCHGSIR